MAKTSSPSLKLEDFVRFNQELESIARSRIPLSSGMRKLGEEFRASSRLRKVAEEVAAGLERGRPLSQALEESGHQFPRLYVELIRVGEKSESLPAILNAVVQSGHRELEMRSALKTILTYPVAVLALAFGIVILLSVYVVPHFIQLYEEMGAELPRLTLWLITALDWFTDWTLFIPFGLLILLVILVRNLYRVAATRRVLDTLVYRLPLFGSLFSVHHSGQWCRVMGELLRGGVSLDEALDCAAEAVPNQVMRSLSHQAAQQVRRGGHLLEPFEHSFVFPPSFEYLIGRGEQRGDLQNTFTDLADLADARSLLLRQRALVFFEPFLLIVLGLSIAFLVISLYFPLFTLPRIF